MTSSATPRPPLPVRHQNANIKDMEPAVVKYQVLNCQGNDILVGRLKVDTPTSSGHAFILRRFDTGAVSLTTMFRAAFPNAPEDLEKREVQWVKDTYDLTGNNGSSKDTSVTRLAGTWVSPAVALELGEQYFLGDLIHSVVQAKPDPTANYRRSKKDAAPTPPTSAQPPSRTLSTTASSMASPTPAKRRKESSPAPAPPPVTPVAPRRSTRTKSPAPKSSSTMSLTSAAKSMSTKRNSRREEVVTPGGSDETVVDEEGDVIEESVGSELREQDLAEQRDMIANLKAQRDKTLAKQAVADDDAPPAKLKRVREEENKQLEFEFKEPEIGERAIATNRRITPTQKSAVWGMVAFAFGMTAVSFLPNLF
ncbi:apses transcription [Favolaschia claudopus]|uniref:Apses transcription n=1 Tax=Favolaschia claudopus TaxID=2862362 RepID=A0AAW0C364_9AGAR